MTKTNQQPRRLSTHRILAGMKIRKKLIVLHTAFSLGLGIILLIAIRPVMSKVINGAEFDLSQRLLDEFIASSDFEPGVSVTDPLLRVFVGAEASEGVPDPVLYTARADPDTSVPVQSDGFSAGAIRWVPMIDDFILVRARSDRARKTISLVYSLVIITLVFGYGLVAAALELFVLPQHVYRPISAMLQADHAVQTGDPEHEFIPDSEIPADELGSIMNSRNEAIAALRTNEHELAEALDRLEHIAADLHKKNHLLETARKNLEGADRLASLGMMSAGIAHELNTPLAVVKGLVEKLGKNGELSNTEIALLTRVVGRLETLSDGLLDFARVRPPMSIEADVHDLIEEARTLVTLDRKNKASIAGVSIESSVAEGVVLCCDPDRLVQVFVNLIRNAVDALIESGTLQARVQISLQRETRDGAQWVNICVEDNGPGIDSALIDRLFEPFVSSRLDAQGTGLGLAVANGIVREHGGILIATNRSSNASHKGAVFEVLLPMRRSDCGINQTDEDVSD